MKLLLWVCIVCVAFARKKHYPFNKKSFSSSSNEEDLTSYGFPLNPSLDIPYGSPNDDFPTRRLPPLSYPQINTGPKFPIAGTESRESPYPWIHSASGSSPYVYQVPSYSSSSPMTAPDAPTAPAAPAAPAAAGPWAPSAPAPLAPHHYPPPSPPPPPPPPPPPLPSAPRVFPFAHPLSVSAASAEPAGLSFEAESAATATSLPIPAEPPAESLSSTEMTADPLSSIEPTEATEARTAAAKHAAAKQAASQSAKYGAAQPADVQSAASELASAEMGDTQSASAKPDANKSPLDKTAVSESQPSPLGQILVQKSMKS